MSFKHIADFVPDYQGLPTLDEMYSHTSILVAQKNPLVTIRPLGVSREGEPIELISVGCGKHQALLVGTPHPNEPIGCLTIEFLLDHLIHICVRSWITPGILLSLLNQMDLD